MITEKVAVLKERQEKAAPPPLKLLSAVLKDAKDTVESWGGEFYFVYLPEWQRYGAPERANKYRDDVLSITKELKIETIDIHKVFMKHGDPKSNFPFSMEGHNNEKGYKRIADEILQTLASDK